MKFSKSNFLALVIAITWSFTLPAAIKNGGDSGGGGEPEEIRFDEIRSDILKWIKNGGANALRLPEDISYGDYVKEMTNILQPKNVIVGFTEDKVLVKNVEKTCKGYITEEDEQANILCNISRFNKTSEAQQYKLVHHEYAGLVNIEKNEGAISDYAISKQITSYLTEEKVLKLAVKSTAGELGFMPDKLFGEYPAKFNCYLKDHIPNCNTPSVEDIEMIIENYKTALPDLKKKIDRYLNPYENYRNQLLSIAKETEDAKGANLLSKTFRAYVNELEWFEQTEKYYSKILASSPYMKFLEEMKVVISKDPRGYYGFINHWKFKNAVSDFNSAVKILPTNFKLVQFEIPLNMGESCTSIKRKGKWNGGEGMYVPLNLYAGQKDPKTFDPFLQSDLELLKIMLLHNAGPLKIECVKVSKNIDLKTQQPVYDRKTNKLIISYQSYEGMRPKIAGFGLEFTRVIVDNINDNFVEDFKSQL